jgi:protocatechuate 3,4-dioxygenase, alpha subunit
MSRLPISPNCTIGPFFPYEFMEDDLTHRDGKTAQGQHILLTGRVLQEGGGPTRNTILEIWQADANGVLHHPLDPRHAEADPGFAGWGRARTDADGWYRFRTIVPGRSASRCPHINVMILALGLTWRLVTTAFFAGSPELVADPVLDCVKDPAARLRLFPARAPELDTSGACAYRFDIILRGENETPFFLD